ncbi:MAG: PIN domain-containing protein [Proteobacteria bacterium]|nr:PIN domain-containing protein [Pseudomonadota bacterium]MBU1640514.1 PIN domain-containing protein [Pseudomonadota bacterium]
MSVLVDTSIWVEYFRNGNNFDQLDFLIDENLVVTNDLILSELIPFLKVRNQRKLIALLNKINKLEIVVNWELLIEDQCKCLKNGINGIGIPDLIIAQNAKQNHCSIYSLDNHFNLIKDILKIKLFDQ